MTLAEVLVYAVLSALLTAGLYLTLASALRYLGVTQAGQEVGQQGLVAIRVMTAGLRQTRLDTVRPGSDPPGVVFLSARDTGGHFRWDDLGRLEWQKWVAFYLDGDRLIRKEEPLSEPTVHEGALSQSVSAMAGNSSLAEQVVADHVSKLQVLPGPPLEIRLDTEAESKNGTYELEFRASVEPRS